MRKHPVLASVCICLASIAATLVFCVSVFSLRFGGFAGLRDALRIVEARRVIEDYYVGSVDEETLTYGALAGLVDSTGDRWSYYMNEEEFQSYLDASANQYTGVGITVRASDDGRGLYIAGVQEDSPAERAGILEGMVLLSINGESLAGKTADDAKRIISASNGQNMLFVLGTAAGGDLSVSLRAEKIQVRVITEELREDGLGYIRIRNFDSGAAAGAIAAVDRLIEEGATGIIFDVRGNPGGKLNELIEVLDYLLPEGILFTSRDKHGAQRSISSGPDCVEIPMAVLIDENTYSAAEFFAAALSEYDWAETVGHRTTGKSRSQINITLSDGGVIHLSTESYLTPNGVDLAEQGGLPPDIPVDDAGEGDAQLDAAAGLLLDAAV